MAEIDEAEAFLAGMKEAVGNASWGEGTRPGLLKVEWPLYLKGQSTGGRLMVQATSGITPQQFTMVVLLGKCLSRLEYDSFASHVNPPPCPKGVPKGRISGSHYHILADNRRLAERGLVPKDLKFARPLPRELNDFASCLLWFCKLNNIELRNDQMPPEPEQPRLL